MLALPLRDTSGRAFRYRPESSLQAALHGLDRFDRVGGAYARRLAGKPAVRKRLLASAVEKFVAATDLPEGAGRGGIKAMVATLLDSPQPPTPARLMAWNGALGGGGRLPQTGEPRAKVVAADGRGFMPPRASLLPRRMAALDRYVRDGTDDFLHPLLHVALLDFWLLHDQPFVEAGEVTRRLARMNELQRRGYDALALIAFRPRTSLESAFYDAVRSRDLSDYFQAWTTELRRAAERVVEEQDQFRADVAALERLSRRRVLNRRQLALVRHALAHDAAEYTIRSHQRAHGVAYATAHADLKDLARREILEESRPGRRGYRYRPASYLKTRLSAL